ncbi:ATP-dependent DNA helicase DinG [Aciduricibacillus chroicocephali]|uniref:3'-5' exonuclease DinG n=1 Tax=Aciduricibacillus chroicocephali TaxID=3054939 RepID=A0ABY9KYW3_9BACI|nr:ATP-dependent DNA helicase DinG [Bacillaceae bacterium 44XB]
MEKYVVVDLETTGHSGKTDKIIEAGIVTIVDGQITDQYSTFLNPGKPIPNFISSLTGIKDEDVANAPPFEEVAKEIKGKFDKAVLIAHNVPFDLGFLNDELAACGYGKLTCPVIDTVEMSRILYPQADSYKLSNIAAYLDIHHDAPHRALSDAYVTALLFLKLREKLMALPGETASGLQKIEKRLKSNLSYLLEKRKQEASAEPEHDSSIAVYNGIAYKKPVQPINTAEQSTGAFGGFIDDLFSDTAKLHEVFGIYEDRPGQKEMAELIYDAFESKEHAIIEAGTGIGKTFGYLIPAAYEAMKRNEQIVISTHTTQLQNQLMEKDIPMLRKLLFFEVRAAILKGKYHYVSLQRLSQELERGVGNYDIALSKAILLVWLTETETGDIDEIQLPSNGYHFYKKICAEAEQVTYRDNYFSHYNYARKKAEEAHLILTNHALLCTDLFSDNALLPSYSRCIIDEAHQFESAAARRFGLKLDYVQIQYALNNLGEWDDSFWTDMRMSSPEIALSISPATWNRVYQDAQHDLDALFRHIFSYVSSRGRGYTDIGRMQSAFPGKGQQDRKWLGIKEMADRLIFRLKELNKMLETALKSISDADSNPEFMQLYSQLSEFISALKLLFFKQDGLNVKWAEIEAKGAKNAVYLYSEPATVAEPLEEMFFSRKECVVLTSATLTMNGSFNFIQKRLGLQEGSFFSKVIPSPFSFKEQIQMLIPEDFPDVRNEEEEFIYSLCEAVLSLAEITEGRMLILFTSFEMLKKCHALLRDILEDEDYTLIAQGITSGSRVRLTKNFQSYEKAILLGTSSFWEGIDIPGADLSALVIARLPFQPPNHPLYEARARRLESEGRNPFYELSLPHAVLRFRQGFGRLIRSNHDRGFVLICDTRIIKSSYGKYFLNSVPKVPIVTGSTGELIEKARGWF